MIKTMMMNRDAFHFFRKTFHRPIQKSFQKTVQKTFQTVSVVVCMGLGLILSPLALGQLTLDLSGKNFWQGQPSRLMVVSPNTADISDVLEIPASDDFLITVGSPVSLKQGSIAAVGYPVRLTPLKAGVLALPSFHLQNKPSTETGKQTIDVKAPSISDGMSINVKRSADEIYLGQSVKLEFEWITSLHPRALKAVNILVPELDHGNFRAIEPAFDDQAISIKPIGLPVGNRRITGRWEKLEEKRVRIFFDYVLQPREAGTYNFTQPVLLASVDNKALTYRRGEFKGMRYPPHFDNNFFDQVRNPDSPSIERVIALAEPFSINVKPLPQGAPQHFSGIVGRPEVSVSTDASSVRQGDPVKVAFRINHPDIEVFELPPLKEVLAFNQVFDIPVTPDPPVYKNGEKIIQQTVFPDSPDIQSLPSLVINYFDPDSGQYRDYVTESVPLEVLPVTQFNFSGSELPADVLLVNQVVPSDKGIWAHLWGKSILSSQYLSDRSVQLGLLLFILLPPLLFVIKVSPLLLGLWQHQQGRTPLSRFREQLQQGDEPLTQLGLYLSRKAGLAPSRLNSRYIEQVLTRSQIDPADIGALTLWLDSHQQQFSSTAAASKANSEYQSDTQDLIHIITRIDRQLPDRLNDDIAAGVFS